MGPQELTTWGADESKFVLEHYYQLYTPITFQMTFRPFIESKCNFFVDQILL